MRRNILLKLIILTVLSLIVVLLYKVYIDLHETDLRGSNTVNIEKIEALPQKEDYSFAVIGSAENSIDIFQNKIIKSINTDPDILFMTSTGSSVLDGAEDKYRILKKSLDMLKVPYIIGIGNSEVSDGGDRVFYRYFGPFYYSYSYAGSYFIFIDTTGITSSEVQKRWITDELNKADRYDHIFMFMDSSPVNITMKSQNSGSKYIHDKAFSSFLTEQLSLHHVDGVFIDGSEYGETEFKGVHYYSTGGAGGLQLNNSNFYYLKAEVSKQGVNIKAVEIPFSSSHRIIRYLERIWIYIHSVFYAQYLNILLLICSVILVLLLFYKRTSVAVDYYKNFNIPESSIDIDKKLNIAMFTNNYLPFVGGVPISVHRLAKALRERGNRVVIFAPKYLDQREAKEDEDVFRCSLLFYKKYGNFNFAIANIFSPAIRNRFKAEDFDVVHVHHPFWLGAKGLRLGRKSNIPVVLTYHTRLEMYSDNLPIFKQLFKNILSHRIIKSFGQKCDGIIAPTVSAEEYLANVGVSRDKIVVPTGIDFRSYEKQNDNFTQEIRDRFAPDGELLLLTVSRLSIEKNIAFLIKGLSFIKEHTKVKFKCIMIGDGPEREHIKKMITEYSLSSEVNLIGSVRQEDIIHYYTAADVFIFSSLSETQGMVLLEAMAGKCPVVCIRSSGTDDVIRDGFNGYKTADSIMDWSEKIIRLLEDEDTRKLMGENAYSFARKFSIEKMAERIELFYKKVRNKKGSRGDRG